MIDAMAKSNRENEIKLAFDARETAVERLVKAGAQPEHERAFEDNVLFDLADRRLTRSGRILRLRDSRGKTLLTFKGPVEGDHAHKVRTEHETEVGDPASFRSILSELGFEIVYRYQKYRSTYTFEEVEAAVDETPIGTFVELEGPPDQVERAAAALGARPSEFIRATYRELQEQHAAKHGIVAGDMLMPRRGPGSPR